MRRRKQLNTTIARLALLLLLMAGGTAPLLFGQNVRGTALGHGGWHARCGTRLLPEQIQLLRNKPHGTRYSASPARNNPVIYTIPVAFRILCRDDSTGCLPLSRLIVNLCEAQANHFAPADIRFAFLLDEIRWFYNTQAYDGEPNASTNLVFSNMSPNRMNVFVMGSNNYCGIDGLCGCVHCCATDAVTMAGNCVGSGQITYSHEVGHWLGLPHTFDQISCKECVDRNNCYTCGDMFCDTEADYLGYRWQCPFTGDSVEPATCPPPLDTIHPDPTLIMSYAFDECITRFTPEQRAHMRYVIENYAGRQWIMQYQPPVRQPPQPIQQVWFEPDTPPAGKAYVRWRAADQHATHFLVEVYQLGYLEPVFERLVPAPDSFIQVSGLLPNQRYKAVVRPLNELYFCTSPTETPWTPTQNASFHAWAELSYIPCTAEGGATVTIHARSGQPPYIYWHAQTGWQADSVFCRLPGGWHTFKVRDQNNSQIRLVVWIDSRLVVPIQESPTALAPELHYAGTQAQPQHVLPVFWENGTWRLPTRITGWIYTLSGKQVAFITHGTLPASLTPGMYWLVPQPSGLEPTAPQQMQSGLIPRLLLLIR